MKKKHHFFKKKNRIKTKTFLKIKKNKNSFKLI